MAVDVRRGRDFDIVQPSDAGRATEVELKERKHRIEDAVRNATAAIEEGVVVAGGVALLHAADQAFEKLDLAGDEATGANIVRVAAEAPPRQIAINTALRRPSWSKGSAASPPGGVSTRRPASTST